MRATSNIAATELHTERFLAAVADPARPIIEANDVAIVVAHPDDETIGCGALLPRLRDAKLILVTDGAPRNLFDATNYGFASAEAYAQARRRELEHALGLAGVSSNAVTRLDIPDQQAGENLAVITRRLVELFTHWRTAIAITHAFEGGHPDHDSAAFAITAAAKLLARNGQRVGVVEFPLYRADVSGRARQSFVAHPDRPEIEILLSDHERALTQRMAAMHATQRGLLKAFPFTVERFRRAPPYDLAALPNDGRLLYEQYDWGMRGERWLTLASAALRELGLQDSA